MQKTMLVAGAAGFIGSHLVRTLVEQGHRVIGVDSLITGDRRHLRGLSATGRFVFKKHDITRPLKIQEPIHEIYNLACPASPAQYFAHPFETIAASVDGIRQLLELARAKNATLLHTSTSEVYGDPEVHPQPETYVGSVNPIGPRACYDEGKRLAETLCFEYIRQYQANVKVVRIFNTYGPNMAVHDGRVVSNFIVAALRGEPILVDGDGTQTRSFCYVSDLVDGLVRMMASPVDVHGPINLGNPEERTVYAFAQEVVTVTKSSSAIVRTDKPREDDPRRRQPDITRARTLLGWEPRVTLRDGLKQTITYFKKELRRTAPNA